MKATSKIKQLEYKLKVEKRKLKSQKYRTQSIQNDIKSSNNWYKQQAEEFREQLRLNATKAERLVLQFLTKSPVKEHLAFQEILYIKKKSRIVKFYIADFILTDKNLIIEIDGEYHNTESQKLKDKDRELDLYKLGYSIIRITNEDVYNGKYKTILNNLI